MSLNLDIIWQIQSYLQKQPSKPEIVNLLSQLQISFSKSLKKSDLIDILRQYLSSLQFQQIKFDPVELYYGNAIKNIKSLLALHINLIPQNTLDQQFMTIFFSYFSEYPDFSSPFPANFSQFSLYKEFTLMKRFKINYALSREQVNTFYSNKYEFVDQFQSLFLSPNTVDQSTVPIILNSRYNKLFTQLQYGHQFKPLFMNNKIKQIEDYETLIQYNGRFYLGIDIVDQLYFNYCSEVKLNDRLNYTTFYIAKFGGNFIGANYYLIKLKPEPVKEPEKPGYQFITAFIRSCIIFKFSTRFDVIDYTNLFKELSKQDTSQFNFTKLNELYKSDQNLFNNVLTKNLQALHQTPEKYKLNAILSKPDSDLEQPTTIIPCIDAVSMESLKEAGRGTQCFHVQCLNASSFGGKCPLCGSPVQYILLDILTQKLITFVQSQNKTKVIKSIEVDNDFFKILNVNYIDDDDEDGWFDDEEKAQPMKEALKEEIIDIDDSDDNQKPVQIKASPDIAKVKQYIFEAENQDDSVIVLD
ncbi:Conserved_hypothetical protein [Hexamita inflata]|uniref:Uncharacterized protein n=1 Tax=Hexamita inflata TaxID=28002 RepID=A0AA86NFG0_9EUKA|nr:Conserved hypothetical protein [Hexamita inflata]